MPLDKGTKIYAAVLGGVVLLGLVAWLLTLDPRLGEIDRMLQADPEIAAYPYHFHVLEIQKTTAVVSTPRTPAASRNSLIDNSTDGMPSRP